MLTGRETEATGSLGKTTPAFLGLEGFAWMTVGMFCARREGMVVVGVFKMDFGFGAVVALVSSRYGMVAMKSLLLGSD